jgi:hypothetical protein
VLKSLRYLPVFLLSALATADASPSVGLAPTVPAISSTTPTVSIQFTNTGLTSVQWNDTQMLASGSPGVSYIGLIQPNGSWTSANCNPTSTSADVPNRILTQTYTWGSIRYAYTTTETQLFADVTIQNTTSTPIGMFLMQLLEIKFPQTPSQYDGSDPMVGWGMGNPTIVHTSFGTGEMDLTNEDVVNPLMVGWPWALDSAKTIFPLLVFTGADSMYPTSFPFINRQVPPGGSIEFKLGFRFGSPGANDYQLAGDVYQSFAAAFPQTLQWTDRRPVAQLFLTSYNGTYPTNPRRWFGDGSVNVTTPAGIAAFQQRVLQYAAQSVAICQAENAQAAITWDIEGQQFPQATSYIGDPRLVDTLAPEISGVIDAYFKTFTNAGIRVGMTIRPQQLVLSDSNTQASQVEVADPGQLMLQKITYAYNRWGATVFYVDSNGAPDNPIDPKYFKEVTDALPNVLLIPEHSNMGYYPITAPYGQLNMGTTGTPPVVSWTYPQAFSVFTISDADVTDNWATLVNSVAHGDALFFRGWFNANENPQVQQIYQQAATTGTE